MDHDEIMEKLRKRLDENMDAFFWSTVAKTSNEVYSLAREIAAGKEVYNLLYGSGSEYSDEQVEYLLRFKDPLKVLREEWVKNHGFDRTMDMQVMLDRLAATREAEYENELTDEFLDPRRLQGQQAME